jgi:hypothetical protein
MDEEDIEEEIIDEDKPKVWYEHHVRHVVPNRKKLRNLKQNKDLSDDEFEDMFEKKYLSVEKSNVFEKQINDKLKEFEQEYDLSDMKVNDRASLRALVQAVIALEDYEQLLFQLRTNDEGINADNIYAFDRINKVMSDLREDINKLQAELKISRRSRKSDSDSSFIDYLESVKAKAKQFYEAKMSYMYCPKCKTLLGTIWTLYPEEPKNKIRLVCNREIDDKIFCDGEIVVGTKEMLDNKGSNHPELMPLRMN